MGDNEMNNRTQNDLTARMRLFADEAASESALQPGAERVQRSATRGWTTTDAAMQMMDDDDDDTIIIGDPDRPTLVEAHPVFQEAFVEEGVQQTDGFEFAVFGVELTDRELSDKQKKLHAHSRRHRISRKLALVTVAMAFIAMTVFVVLRHAKRHVGPSSSTTSSITSAPLSGPLLPTIAPSSSPSTSAVPTSKLQLPNPTVPPTPLPTLSRNRLETLIQSRSPSTVFRDSSLSPQDQALAWLLKDLYSQQISDDRLIQRFALATLWYSTNGEEWDHSTGWLEASDECSEWNNVGEGGQDGIVCGTLQDGNVQELHLEFDNLFGTIPHEIGLLSHLTRLILYGNDLKGTIPTEMGKLTNLFQLWLNTNSLSGVIPTEMESLTRLELLDLADLPLGGSIPSELGALTQLTSLSLSRCGLEGHLPTEIGQWTQLTEFWADTNKLTGAIPSQIGQWRDLISLNLRTNALTGSIPAEFEMLTRLNFLRLYENPQLSGSIPSSICSASTIAPQVDCEMISCDCCVASRNTMCVLQP